MVDIPVSRNCLSILKQYGSNVAEFCKETRYHLFGSTSLSFEFHLRPASQGRRGGGGEGGGV